MSERETEAIKRKAVAKRKRKTLRGNLRSVTEERDAARRQSRAWKKLAKVWREHAKYALEKPSLGAQVRNWMLYCAALKRLNAVGRYVTLVRDGYPRGAGKPGNDNAPGHGHSIPGIWDRDNKPEIAGKPCELCVAWNEAVAALPAKGV